MFVEEHIADIIKYIKRIPYKYVYIGDAPIDVDECVVIRAASGTSKVHFEKETYDYPHYTIHVRASTNQRANDLVSRVYDRLANYTADNCAILIRHLPHFVGRDQKNRSLYSFTIEYQLGGY